VSYRVPDYRLNPPEVYDRADYDRIRLEEFAAHEGRAVALATLARVSGNRLQALLWCEWRWSDESLREPVEPMVRREAIASLLGEANPIERDAYEATHAFGVDTYEAALAAVTLALTHLPLPEHHAA
jgi:hypothetical protein